VTLDRTLGDSTGWFGLGTNTDSFFSGQSFNKAGYPGSPYSGTDLYTEFGPVLGAVAGTSSYFGAIQWSTSSLSASPGQSGSGLDYYTGNNNETLYGVQDVGGGSYGYAERITAGVYNDLNQWRGQDLVPTVTSLAASTYAPTAGQSVTFTA